MDNELSYITLLQRVLQDGVDKSDRTGTGTRSRFGESMQFNMHNGFPLFTGKTVNFRAVRAELLWFLSGSTNIHDLDAHIWDEWADEQGDLGPIYGEQWRRWQDADALVGYDQIQKLEQGLRDNPDSRRHIVNAWNVADLPFMRLAPCHLMFQCNSRPATHKEQSAMRDPITVHHNGDIRFLDLQVYQRSADLFLGVPFNVASYALLLHMLAQTTGHVPGTLYWVGGDCHIYHNHFEAVNTYLSRRHQRPQLPRLVLDPVIRHIDEFQTYHIRVADYNPMPKIEAPIAV